MLKRLPLTPIVLFVAAALAMGACTRATSPTPPQSPALTTVPIADFKTVAGKWEGLVKGMPARGSSKDDDFVDLTITPDGGYDFGIYRTIGVFGGTGKFALENGQLVMHGERGSTTLTLLEGGGQRILRANGVMKNGVRLFSDLTPAR